MYVFKVHKGGVDVFDHDMNFLEKVTIEAFIYFCGFVGGAWREGYGISK